MPSITEKLFIEYYYVLDIVLWNEGMSEDKADQFPYPYSIYILAKEQKINDKQES